MEPPVIEALTDRDCIALPGDRNGDRSPPEYVIYTPDPLGTI